MFVEKPGTMNSVTPEFVCIGNRPADQKLWQCIVPVTPLQKLQELFGYY
jgi:hypothetical protein